MRDGSIAIFSSYGLSALYRSDFSRCDGIPHGGIYLASIHHGMGGPDFDDPGNARGGR